MDKPSPLHAALETVDIYVLWSILELPGHPARNGGISPFPKDRGAAFHVWTNKRGKTWFKNFRTGEIGNAVNFLMYAREYTKSEACREIIRIAQQIRDFEKGESVHKQPTPSRGFPPHRAGVASRPTPIQPLPTQKPNEDELKQLAESMGWICNGIPITAGLRLAVDKGVLHTQLMITGNVAERIACFTDQSRAHAQIRKLDGSPFNGGNAKVMTVAKSDDGWPIGAANIGPAELVLIVTEAQDSLAAHGFLADLINDANLNPTQVCVVFAPNLNQRLHPASLRHFRNKFVLIYSRADNTPEDTEQIQFWIDQLLAADAKEVHLVDVGELGGSCLAQLYQYKVTTGTEVGVFDALCSQSGKREEQQYGK